MQRTVTPFTRAEWERLVKLPGRVVVAATSAQADSARHTVHEGLAGIDAIAAGRASASRLTMKPTWSMWAVSSPESRSPRRTTTLPIASTSGSKPCAVSASAIQDATALSSPLGAGSAVSSRSCETSERVAIERRGTLTERQFIV